MGKHRSGLNKELNRLRKNIDWQLHSDHSFRELSTRKDVLVREMQATTRSYKGVLRLFRRGGEDISTELLLRLLMSLDRVTLVLSTKENKAGLYDRWTVDMTLDVYTGIVISLQEIMRNVNTRFI